jgi:hypothetical protein
MRQIAALITIEMQRRPCLLEQTSNNYALPFINITKQIVSLFDRRDSEWIDGHRVHLYIPSVPTVLINSSATIAC